MVLRFLRRVGTNSNSAGGWRDQLATEGFAWVGLLTANGPTPRRHGFRQCETGNGRGGPDSWGRGPPK